MAEDVTSLQPAAEVAPAAPPEPSVRPHWLRFYAVYVLLGAALFGAAVIGVVAGTKTASPPGPAWSSWRPSGGGLGAELEIARKVGAEYALSDGSQLVDVIANPPSVKARNQTVDLGYLAVRGHGGKSDSVVPVSGSNSVMYTLCGLGPSCTIATGTPSVGRGLVVRREILELALYTFHYVGGVDNVIAFMPPSASSKPAVVVYLRRSDLSSELRVPLAQSLDPQGGKLQRLPAKERRLVEKTTDTRAYSFNLTQAQDGNAVLILTRLAA